VIRFITGSRYKLEEVRAVVPDIEQLEMDLPEIQELDPHAIIKAKLEAAFAHAEGEFIVEDTSLYLEALGGFPGPLIKWFLKALGLEGLVSLCEKLGDDRAVAKTVIGYAKHREEISFFEGVLSGRIVRPRAASDFGWDAIFLPDGHDKTFAEMSREEKNAVSMRGQAAGKLKGFLQTAKP